jgi:hypothetical protein
MGTPAVTTVEREHVAEDEPVNPLAQVLMKQLHLHMVAAKLSLDMARQRYKRIADKKRSDVRFQQHQEVLLSTKNLKVKSTAGRKLAPRWVGPFRVVERIGPVAYRLDLPTHWRMHDVFHVSLLKSYRRDRGDKPGPLPALADGHLEWGVRAVLAHEDKPLGKSGRYFQRFYLVRWEGRGPEWDSWEPARNLGDSEPVEQYWRQLGGELPSGGAAP